MHGSALKLCLIRVLWLKLCTNCSLFQRLAKFHSLRIYYLKPHNLPSFQIFDTLIFSTALLRPIKTTPIFYLLYMTVVITMPIFSTALSFVRPSRTTPISPSSYMTVAESSIRASRSSGSPRRSPSSTRPCHSSGPLR